MLILTSKNHGENAINGTAYCTIVSIKTSFCEARILTLSKQALVFYVSAVQVF